ncbi:MAG: hypothetical protein Q8S21_03520 [Candidatus Paracaedibacteraceae bacterium]|nr:hypothetical protein [Candidatus Paracaedibacteraceae bacterium]
MKKLNYFMTALYLTVANSTMDVYAAALLTRNGTSTTLSKSEIIERQDAEIDKQFERKLALEKQQHGILEKKIAKEKIFEMRETLTDFAQELQSQIK